MIEKAQAVIDAVEEKMQGSVTYLEEDLKTYRAGTRPSSTMSW